MIRLNWLIKPEYFLTDFLRSSLLQRLKSEFNKRPLAKTAKTNMQIMSADSSLKGKYFHKLT